MTVYLSGMVPVTSVTPYTSLFGFVVGLPTLAGAYYQAWKARQESRRAREAFMYSENCLEFVRNDGTTVNLVPLVTLHALPKTGDIVLLPGSDHRSRVEPAHGAYRILRIEHIYARAEARRGHADHARLAKTVAHVDCVSIAERP